MVHQLLVHAVYVNILTGRKCTYCKKNTFALVVPSNKIGLEVNADTTKHMGLSNDRNAGGIHIKRLIMVPLNVWNSSNI
jgi:hypothetical protein